MPTIMKGGVLPPPRICLFGGPKLGKTTTASETDKPIFVITEEGLGSLSVDHYPLATTWEDVLANIRDVASSPHDYRTIVIDTISGAVQLAAESVCSKYFKGDWGAKGYNSFGAGDSATSEEIKRLLPILDSCRSRGMMVMLLSHAGLHTVRDPVAGDYTKHAPDINRKSWSRLAAWLDVIGHIEYSTTVLKQDDGRTKVIADGSRIVRFSGSSAEDAGFRVGYSLPSEMPLSWPAIRDALGNVTPLVASVRSLWPKLSPEDETKALKFLGIASLAELGTASPSKLAQINNRLKEIPDVVVTA